MSFVAALPLVARAVAPGVIARGTGMVSRVASSKAGQKAGQAVMSMGTPKTNEEGEPVETPQQKVSATNWVPDPGAAGTGSLMMNKYRQ